jgi:hypothetical protein
MKYQNARFSVSGFDPAGMERTFGEAEDRWCQGGCGKLPAWCECFADWPTCRVCRHQVDPMVIDDDAVCIWCDDKSTPIDPPLNVEPPETHVLEKYGREIGTDPKTGTPS